MKHLPDRQIMCSGQVFFSEQGVSDGSSRQATAEAMRDARMLMMPKIL